jgi:predicted esterase
MRARLAVVLVVGLAASLGVVQPAQGADGTRYVDVIFDDVDVTRDITYGVAPASTGVVQQLQLDLYQPAGDTATDRGLLIWAHGSGFRYGSRSDAGPVEDYVRRGWVGMSISYRMRPELPANAFVGIVTNPTSVSTAQAAARDAQHDMQAAVRWARAHAAELGIDPDRIAVGGISAGGIIALMTAFNPGDPGDSGTPGVSSEVAAAVSHAGAYVPGLQGAAPAAGAPPVAMYHGTNDEQVPQPTSPPACALTILMGNDCEYVLFVGREHTTLGVDLAQQFLYRHVIAPTTAPTPIGVADLVGDPTVLAGVEQVSGQLGGTAGVVVPGDPQVVMDHTLGLVEYVLEALGLPVALPD